MQGVPQYSGLNKACIKWVNVDARIIPKQTYIEIRHLTSTTFWLIQYDTLYHICNQNINA